MIERDTIIINKHLFKKNSHQLVGVSTPGHIWALCFTRVTNERHFLFLFVNIRCLKAKTLLKVPFPCTLDAQQGARSITREEHYSILISW